MITENRAEYREACASTRKMSEEARQNKWEEFLADLENKPDPTRTWRTTKVRGEKTRGPEIGSRSALIVVAHVFSWPPARMRHVRGPHQRPGGFARSSTQHGDSPPV